MRRFTFLQQSQPRILIAAGLIAAVSAALAFADEPVKPAAGSVGENSKQTADDHTQSRVPLAVARDRARLMHQIYTSTLDVMHDRYFHADRAVVPARAMEDVFENLQKETGSKANWISVNLKAMSIDHDPETEFEKHAAKELSSGKPELELVADGYYRRATPIPLNGGCAGCHAGFSPQPSTRKFLAGLIISIPVTEEK